MNDTGRSAELFERALRVIPGGVSSPVRAFRAVGGTPRVIASGSGSRLIDEDGREYLDFVCSWGALPLGHAHPDIVHGDRIDQRARHDVRRARAPGRSSSPR